MVGCRQTDRQTDTHTHGQTFSRWHDGIGRVRLFCSRRSAGEHTVPYCLAPPPLVLRPHTVPECLTVCSPRSVGPLTSFRSERRYSHSLVTLSVVDSHRLVVVSPLSSCGHTLTLQISLIVYVARVALARLAVLCGSVCVRLYTNNITN